ncbi:uncharacterized protein LOC122930694 [Bufo gargarizans]|uniref:uncharacterized protein LOC122930694 n=1 Tax=Bufo gargarizans TaxID=30331 RepID=UPI001CF45CDC|nr:uncharacterized protein LOC122930694 [Bufo gargarizans]
MMEDHQTLTSPGRSSKRRTPERCPSPHPPQDHQLLNVDKDLNNINSTYTYVSGDAQCKEEISTETYLRGDDQCMEEISTETYLRGDAQCKEEISTETYVRGDAQCKEEISTETYVRGDAQCKEEISTETYVRGDAQCMEEILTETYVSGDAQCKEEISTETYVRGDAQCKEESSTETYVRGDDQCKQDIPTDNHRDYCIGSLEGHLISSAFKANGHGLAQNTYEEHATILDISKALHSQNCLFDPCKHLPSSGSSQTVKQNQSHRRGIKDQRMNTRKKTISCLELPTASVPMFVLPS